jgi:hypothetical protein
MARYKSESGENKVEHILLGPRSMNESYTVNDPDPSSTIHSPITGQVIPASSPCIFFIFRELGVRRQGTFRLRFSLMSLKEPSRSFVQSVTSDSFKVLSSTERKETRMTDSTLTVALRQQGLMPHSKRKKRKSKDEVNAESSKTPRDHKSCPKHKNIS